MTLKGNGHWRTFYVPTHSILPERFPDMTHNANFYSVVNRRKQHIGADSIGWYKGLSFGKITAHCTDDSSLRVVCPGSVRPIPMTIDFADSYGDHQ